MNGHRLGQLSAATQARCRRGRQRKIDHRELHADAAAQRLHQLAQERRAALTVRHTDENVSRQRERERDRLDVVDPASEPERALRVGDRSRQVPRREAQLRADSVHLPGGIERRPRFDNFRVAIGCGTRLRPLPDSVAVIDQRRLEPAHLRVRAEPLGDLRALPAGIEGGVHVSSDLVRDRERVRQTGEHTERAEPRRDLDRAPEVVEAAGSPTSTRARPSWPSAVLDPSSQPISSASRSASRFSSSARAMLPAIDARTALRMSTASCGRLGGSSAISAVSSIGVLVEQVASALQPVADGEQHLGFRGARGIALGEQDLPGLFEARGIVGRPFEHGRGSAKEQPPALGVIFRPELQGRVVETLGRFDGVERCGSIARIAERVAGSLVESGGVEPRRPSELERLEVVVGQHLGLILRAAERLDPGGGAPVLLGADAAGIWP